MVISLDEYGVNVDNEINFTEVSYHRCQENDIQYFHEKVDEQNAQTIVPFFKYLNCFDDPSSLDLAGWIGKSTSPSGHTLILSMKRCDS